MVLRNGISWAGLLAGPAAWAVSFQTGYALVPWQCANGSGLVPWISAAGIVAALAGGLLSWRAWNAPLLSPGPPAHKRTRVFVAALSVGAASLFALVMILQLLAGLIFEGCEL